VEQRQAADHGARRDDGHFGCMEDSGCREEKERCGERSKL
jgi:hypothetical protein